MTDNQPTDEELTQWLDEFIGQCRSQEPGGTVDMLLHLQARLRELSAELESLQIRYDGMTTGRRCERESLTAENDQLIKQMESERDRYRDALEPVAEGVISAEIINNARKALNGEGTQ